MFNFVEWNVMEDDIVDISGDDNGAVYYWSSLPFYAETTLVKRVVGDASGTSESFWLSINDELYELNGESSAIHWANDEEHLALQACDAPAYLKFFSRFVKGEEGAFFIVEHPDDPLIATYAMSDDLRRTIRPLSIDGIGANGGYAISGFLQYGYAVFRVSFEVSRDGCVAMTDGECVYPVDLDLIQAEESASE
jgi:hypothetical protein